MKLLGFLLQNKKNEPLLIASTPCLQTRNVILYSHSIYEHILEIHRSRSKVQRTILLEHNLLCVYFISQQYICYVFVRKQDLALAFDGLKKIKEYFSVKGSQASKLEGISRRLVEYMSSMEQFLYTRELSISFSRDLYMPFTAPTVSKKKGVDFQIFSRFAHITQEADRRSILEAQMLASKVQAKEILKKCKTIEKAQKFVKRGQDDELEDLLETDPEKENYIKNYRKAIIKLGVAVGGRKKKQRLGSISMAMSLNSNTEFMTNSQTSFVGTYNTQNSLTNSFSINPSIKSSQKVEQSIMKSEQDLYLSSQSFQESVGTVNNNINMNSILNYQEQEKQLEKERLKMIKIKILEKLQLHLHNGKVKEVVQFGQILVENSHAQKDSGSLSKQKEFQFSYLVKLISQHWTNQKILNRRISPNSIQISQLADTVLEFKSNSLGAKPKPIIDYVLRKETFTPEKIPLLFIYTSQVSSNNIEFIFKYKLNDKFQKKLTDVDITVYLNPEFIPMDCKTVPAAHSLKNSKITWKTKQISWGGNNKAKGKLLLAFGSTNIPPKKIIKEVKLSMKCSSGLVDGMEIGLQAEDSDKVQERLKNFQKDKQKEDCIHDMERSMIIEYKVAPNDSNSH